MAFVSAMNDILNNSDTESDNDINDTTQIGVNGATIYTEEGVEDYRVSLFTMLNRDVHYKYIKKYINKIYKKGDKDEIADLYAMAFQSRDIRGGKGEKEIFYTFMKYLYKHNPSAIEALVDFIPEYGCWKDMWVLYNKIPQLRQDILIKTKKVFLTDILKHTSGEYTSLSLLAKWLPREKSLTFKGMARNIANYIYNDIRSDKIRMMKYRKDCSMLNKTLDTVEINMCGNTWNKIIPEHVPGRCMKSNKKAFLNEKLKSTAEGELRHPTSDDRMECRQNFLAFIEDLKAGKKTAHGANVVMPHELVSACLSRKTSEAEKDIIQAQWESIRSEIIKCGGIGKCVPMCDFSGSMSGLPKLISTALGILISEVNHPAFKDHILTFDSTPTWHSFKGMSTLDEKLNSLRRDLGIGLSTDFYKACMLILDKLVEYCIPVGEEPEDIIVLTDMGWDDATKSYDMSHDNTESNNTNTNTNTKWMSQLEYIRYAFRVAGEKLWGKGNGWKVPRIVVWNLSAKYNNFHAKASDEGVVILSGWSSSVLKVLQKGGIEVVTPIAGLRQILDDERYKPIYQTVSVYL
jgi:hypothetical protein